jgi:hypothetical protein
VKFKGTLKTPRIDLNAYRAALHERLSKAIVEAAHEWLDATVIALVPEWSGASVSTFYHLARAVEFSLTAGTAGVAPDRRAEGRQAGDGGLEIDRAKGVYTFKYGTTLRWLIYNEFNNANVNPDPGLFYRLKQPGPYRFQEAGAKAFRQFAGKVRLPSPWKALKVQAHKVS